MEEYDNEFANIGRIPIPDKVARARIEEHK
jgi:hypothetical protein